ncbi:cyclic nucleotide-binding domain protein (macronuclear) [Tetrahymena thermophila SB210]|uniref:Cyclic nucleotide-binding domain protein n=1 Tax=Tetrahymena thermophila (strain SB210) TaxID=312017 RepID=I7MG53_TETTS|nr:cyclic nucleotide-binding domain protein [Tetrahymena thermophila SB210]EAS01104.2 cyclic nucleotide-binding domain protein [Tetrahymena thermophila SB210]|eukprot:XP_001021349.2 cyclic nucleotide-binding domain protein [Tetrahymena thermophila SB210]
MQAQYKKELLKKKQKYQYFKELFIEYIINYPVFNPSNNIKLIWDLIANIISITIMFFIPICFLYGKPLSSLLGRQLNIISPILLILDLLIKLNTGFYTQGQMCRSRVKILNNLAAQDASDYRRKILIKLKSFQYDLAIAIRQTWLHSRNIDHSDWTIQYLESYYYATVTMITVGYGDITPQNPQEMIFCVFSMMICCGVFAYSINQVGNIFKQFFHLENDIKQNMKVISNYMKNKKVNQELQYQVKQYLNYYWREESSQDVTQETKIINQLSDGLRETLLMEANKLALIDSPIFRENFSPQIIIKTIPLIKEMRFTPEEIIFDEEKIDFFEGSIYFIEKGRVEICSYYSHPIAKRQQMVNKIIQLKSGDSFGQISFFTGKKRTFSVRSLDFCRLLVIRRQDFIQLLQEYPDDYEKFCMIKDSILQYNDTSIIKSGCYACKSSTHLISECPYIHFLPNKDNIILQENKIVQNRSPFERRKKCSYIDLSELLEGAVEILDNNQDIIMQNYDYNYMIQSNSFHDIEEEGQIDEIEEQIQINSKQATKNNQKNVQNPKIGSLVSIASKFEGEISSQQQQQNMVNIDLKAESFGVPSQLSQNFYNQESQLRINSNLYSNLNNPLYQDSSQNKSSSKQKRGSQISQLTSQNSIKIQNIDEQPQRSSVSLGEQKIHDFQQVNSNSINSNSISQNNQKNYNEEINQFAAIFNKNLKLISNNKQPIQQMSSQNQISLSSSQKIRTTQQIQIPQGLSQYKVIQTSNNVTSEKEIPIQKFIQNIIKIQKNNSLTSNQQKEASKNKHHTINQYEDIKFLIHYLGQLGLNKQENQANNNIELVMENLKNYGVYFPYNNLKNILAQINAQYTMQDRFRNTSISSIHQQQVILAINKVNNNLKQQRRKSIFNQNQLQLFNQITNNSERQKSVSYSCSSKSKKNKLIKIQYTNRTENNFNDQKQDTSKLSNELQLNKSNLHFEVDLNKNHFSEFEEIDKNLAIDLTNITSEHMIPKQTINIFTLNTEILSNYQQSQQ